ncbi:hypothetical protein HYT01_00655 [Candidatus Giovannonibacteria bacterium]|nr:hypothetical protein [Candidatus Giovannonibacteria bacterium]
MGFLEIIRWSTSAATVFLAVFGYADQLHLIFLNESTRGLSFVMVMLSFWSWLSYTIYGYLHKDTKLFWSNALGLVLISAILVSFWIY